MSKVNWDDFTPTEPTTPTKTTDWSKFEPVPERSALRGVADLGLEVASGAVKGVKFLSDAAGANNPVSRGLGAVDKFAKELQSEQAQAEDQRMAQIQAEAQDKGVWDQVKAAVSAAGEAPIRSGLGAVATGIPVIGASLLPGVREAAWGARAATLGGVGAAQGVGVVKGSIYDAVKQRSLEAKQTPEQAEALAQQAQSYSGPNAANIAVGGALGALASATGFQPAITRALTGQAATGAAGKGMVRQIGEGVLKEVPLEAAQGGQEQYASNVAEQNAGFNTPTWRGVAGQSALEGILSAPGGAIGGAMDYRSAQAPALPTLDPAAGPLTSAATRLADPNGVISVPVAQPEPPAEGKKAKPAPLPPIITPMAQVVSQPQENPGVLETAQAKSPASQQPAPGSASTGQPAAPSVAVPSAQSPATQAASGPGQVATPVDVAAHSAATSPLNDRPEPTDAQKKVGNYAKGHVNIGGLDLSIENPQGSVRSGTDKNGKAWSNTLQHHYGYVKGSIGNDKDHVDTFVNPGTPPDYKGRVFVVDQVNPDTGRFDEHKVLIGFTNAIQARRAYIANYAPGWKGLKAIQPMEWDQFKVWVKDGPKNKALSEELSNVGNTSQVPTVDSETTGRGNPEPAPSMVPGVGTADGATGPVESAEPTSLSTGATAPTSAKVDDAAVVLDQPPSQPVAESQAPAPSEPGEGAVASAPAAGGPTLPAVVEKLNVTFGGKTYPVESIQDAQRKWTAFRDQAGAGVSEIGNGVRVTDGNGKFVARISYNGRAWATEDDGNAGDSKLLHEAPDGAVAAPTTPATPLAVNPQPPATPVAPTATDVGPKPKKQKGGANLRAAAYDRNPLMTLLAKHGLFHDKTKKNSLKSEFSPDKQVMVMGHGPLFRKTGLQLDAMLTYAIEDGYLLPDSTESDLYELIRRAVAGEKIIPMYAEGVAEQENQRRTDERAAQFDDFLESELENPSVPVEEVDAELQAEFNALLVQAESFGIDVDGILEEAARITENGTQNDYIRTARYLVRKALVGVARSGGSDATGGNVVQGQRPDQAQPEGGGTRGEDAGAQGAAEGEDQGLAQGVPAVSAQDRATVAAAIGNANLTPEETAALEDAYGETKGSEGFSAKLTADVVSGLTEGWKTVAKAIRAIVRKVANAVLTVAVVFNLAGINPQLQDSAMAMPAKTRTETITRQVDIPRAKADYNGRTFAPNVQKVVDWVAGQNKSTAVSLILDPATGTLYVMKGAQVVADSPALFGQLGVLADNGDYSRKSTPAGVYSLKMVKDAEYGTTVEFLRPGDEGYYAIHRVYLGDPKERREQRLASPGGKDNNISYGCINVSNEFYDGTLRKLDYTGDAHAYLLPSDVAQQDSVIPLAEQPTSKTTTETREVTDQDARVADKPSGTNGVSDRRKSAKRQGRVRSSAGSVSVEDAEKAIKGLREAMPNGPGMVVIDSMDDAPAALQNFIEQRGLADTIEGAFHDDKVYLFPANIESLDRLLFVAAHHEIRHRGIAELLGDGAKPLLTSMAEQNRDLMAKAQALLDDGSVDQMHIAVEEVLAEMSIDDIAQLSGFDKLVAAIRQWMRVMADKLRRRGMDTLANMIEPTSWSDADVASFVKRAEAVGRGETEATAGWSATEADRRLAKAYEANNDIQPYLSEGMILPPTGTRASIKFEGKYSNDRLTGLPLNKNGTVTLYYPASVAGARQTVVERKLVAAPGSNKVYLTNESSMYRLMGDGGKAQPTDGSGVMVQIDPALLHLDNEFPNGRKDFFIPVTEGAYFQRKMTKLWALFAPRRKAISPATTMGDIREGAKTGLADYMAMNASEKRGRLKEVRALLKREHNIGTLLSENGKLEKTRVGEYGLKHDGQSVASMGLGMASAQKINDKLSTCPQSAACESLCLGDTSGQNLLYGGAAKDMTTGTDFRAGPRLSQFLKTEALVVHPAEFAVLLHHEITMLERWAKKNDYAPAIRLNVTTDFPPEVWRTLMAAHPGTMFYDYTKLSGESIAPNHFLTYSSTGASQVVSGKTVYNPNSNWDRMVARLNKGQNVAMAFSSRNDMPKFVKDAKTGKAFTVWNGDNYDARFLDPKNPDGTGSIIGLTNKDKTGRPDEAAAKNNGFFLDYDAARDGDTLVIADQSTFAASKTIQVVGRGRLLEEPKKAYTPKRGPNQAQLQLFLDSEPVASQAGPAVEAARRDAVAAVDDLHATQTILALAMSSDLAARQRTSFIGQKISSTEDLAVLAQVYRDPRFETLRVIFTKDDKVISQMGLTTRMPGEVTAILGNDKIGYLRGLADRATKVGATGFYMLHNHPSGQAAASPADESLTTSYATWMGSLKFKGHVIIDTNEYTVIDGKGKSKTLSKDFGQPEAPQHPDWGQQKINNPAEVMRMALAIHKDKDAVTLIVTDHFYRTRGITTLPASAFTENRIKARLLVTRAVLKNAGEYVFAVSHSGKALMNLSGIAGDGIQIANDGTAKSLVQLKAFPTNGRAPMGPFAKERNVRLTPDTSPDWNYLRPLTNVKTAGQKVAEGEDLLSSYNRDEALKKQEAEEAARKVESESMKSKPAQGKRVTADQVDLFNPQGALFSRGAGTGLPPARISAIVDAIRAGWANAPEIVVAANMADPAIPQRVRDYNEQQKSMGATGEPEGFLFGGKVYIVADQISTEGDVVRVLFHESLGHFGLRGAFGNSLKPILNQVALSKRQAVIEKARSYGLDISKESDRLQAAEEVLAELAQTQPELGLVKRAIAAIRAWLRKNVAMFRDMEFSDNDIIANFIIPARNFVERGQMSPQMQLQTAFAKKSAPFYSALAREIDAINAKALHPAEWKLRLIGLAKQGKVKQDEVTWSGLEEWLGLQTGKVTKEQVLDYLAQNGVRVEEVVLGGAGSTFKNMNRQEMAAAYERIVGYNPIDDDPNMTDADLRETLQGYAREAGESDGITEDGKPMTKYNQPNLVLPGGTNYREVLLTLPSNVIRGGLVTVKLPPNWEIVPQSQVDGGTLFSPNSGWYVLDGRTDIIGEGNSIAEAIANADIDPELATESVTVRDAKGADFRSTHWQQPNVLAHIRLNDRTDADGKRVLFVEELQSDWGQAGKKEGFAGNFSDRDRARMAELEAKEAAVGIQGAELTEWAQLAEKSKGRGIPSAPFVDKTDKWLGLALKRIMVMAAQEGYDKVAFVNGEQSAERYDLSKQVSMVSWEDKTGHFRAHAINGKDIVKTGVTANDLPNLIGKDVADKLLKSKPQPQFRGDTDGPRIVSGLDLKVGGEGMKAFYDKIVPASVNTLLKKVGGGKVETVGVNIGDKDAIEKWKRMTATSSIPSTPLKEFESQPGFDITPAMREKVAGGLPMFSNKGQTDAEAQARAKGFTLKAYRGVSKAKPFNDTNSTWLTTNRDVAEAYAEEVMGYDDPDVLTVMVNPKDLPRYNASRLTDAQRAELKADSFGNPQAIGIYDQSDDNPLGGRNVTVIHAPRSAVMVLGAPDQTNTPSTEADQITVYRGADHGNDKASTSWPFGVFVARKKDSAAQYGGVKSYEIPRSRVKALTLDIDNEDARRLAYSLLAKEDEELVDSSPQGFLDHPEIFEEAVAEMFMFPDANIADSLGSMGYNAMQLSESDDLFLVGRLDDYTKGETLGDDPTNPDIRFSNKKSATDFDEAAYRPAVVAWAKQHIGGRTANDRFVWQNFVKWFGDSKVVDAAGNPLVVYHGTKYTFTKFKDTNKTDPGWHGPGHYFYPKELWARGYGPNVMAAYISLKNPAIRSTKDAAMTAEAANKLRQELEAQGHDGVMAYDEDGTLADIVAFEPTQIKSATNTGQAGPSDPSTLKQSAIANTPEFKRWFNGSKVVDKNGKPMVVYHGTGAADIYAFKTPAFFTSDPESANFYAEAFRGDMEFTDNPNGVTPGANVIPVYLSIKNPLDVRDKAGAMKFIEVARRAGAKIKVTEGNGIWDFETDEISNHSEYDGQNLNDLIYSPRVRAQMEKEGYDGLQAWDVLHNDEIPLFIPLSSTQIKSAIGNNGQFDPANPDIRFSRKGKGQKLDAMAQPQKGSGNPFAKALRENRKEINGGIITEDQWREKNNAAANKFLDDVASRFQDDEVAARIFKGLGLRRGDTGLFAKLEENLERLDFAIKNGTSAQNFASQLESFAGLSSARDGAAYITGGRFSNEAQDVAKRMVSAFAGAMGYKVAPASQRGTVRVPIDQIEHGESAMPGGKLTWSGSKDLIANYAARKTPFPAIDAIPPDADNQKWMIEDGSHRVEAAKLRGDEFIDVNVGQFDPSDVVAQSSRTDLGLTTPFDEAAHRPEVSNWAKQKWGDAKAPDGSSVWQNFTQYFGDSKVVDEKGAPLMVSHNTWQKDISVFNTNPIATILGIENPDASDLRVYYDDLPDASASLLGSWFRASGQKDYGPVEYKVYLQLANPYRMSSEERESMDYSQEEAIADFENAPTKAELSKRRAGRAEMALQLRAELIRKGHDGIITTRDGVDEYVVFEPTQIKSAIGNNGQFDPTNPDIRFSRVAAIGQVTDQIKEAVRPIGTVNLWDKTVGTQYHKASKDKDFKRVFDGFVNQTDDTAHYAIESESLAPDILTRLESLGDIWKGLTNSGAKQKADLIAVSKALFANIEGEEGIQQRVYDDAGLRMLFGMNDRQISMYRQARAAVDQSIERLAQTYAAQMGQDQGMDIQRLKNMELDDTVALVQQHIQDMHDELRAQEALRKRSMAEKMQDDDGEGDETRALEKEYGGKQPPAPTQEETDALIGRLRAMEEHAKFLQEHGYMPALRFGQYAVTVTEPRFGAKPEIVHFEMFESKMAANLAASKLAKEYPQAQVEKSVMNPEQYAMFKGVSPETVEMFAKFTGADQTEAYQNYIALAKSARSVRMRELKRKGIAGFSEDATRVMAAFITSNARQSAININQGEITDALTSSSLKRKGDVQREAQKLSEYMNNPLEEARRLRGFMFAYFMGGSVASAAVNLTQPLMQTAPYLSQWAKGKTAGIMLAAAKMAATGKIGNAQLAAALKRAAADGITEPHEIHQLMADASGSSLGGSLKARAAIKAWGSFFSLSEAFNRRLTFIAAYKTAQETNQPEPYEFARKAVYETQGMYAKQNRPNWARGAVGATLFTFKQFSISYVEFLNRLPNRQKAIALTMLVLAAGLQGLPFADDLEDLIDTIGQSLGYNTNSKKALRKMLVDAFGNDIGEILNTGVFTKSAVDVQGRLGMGNLLPATAVFKPSETDKSRTMSELAGPLGGILTSFQKALGKAQRGDIAGGIKETLPVAVKNLAQGIDMASTGVYKDTRGYKVADVDAFDSFAKMLGLQPSVIARQTRVLMDEVQDRSMTVLVESQIADRWAAGIHEKDADQVAQARQTLAAWNENNPESRIVIKPGQIASRVKKMNETRNQRFIKTMPRELRANSAREFQ